MATIENIFSLNDTVIDARHEEYAEEETSIGVSKDAEEHFKCIMDRHNIHAPSTVDMVLFTEYRHNIHAPSTVDMVLFYIETVLTKLHNMQTNVHNGCCGLVVVTVPCPKIICRIINKDKY